MLMLNISTIGWISQELKQKKVFISMVLNCDNYGLDYSLKVSLYVAIIIEYFYWLSLECC